MDYVCIEGNRDLKIQIRVKMTMCPPVSVFVKLNLKGFDPNETNNGMLFQWKIIPAEEKFWGLSPKLTLGFYYTRGNVYSLA